MRKRNILVLVLFICVIACAALSFLRAPVSEIKTSVVKKNEAFYVKKWISQYGGDEEFKLPDKTRVDVLTDEYAIEVDFARKWYEAVGQSLHYGAITGKKPGIVLILRKQHEQKYMSRLLNVISVFSLPIEVWAVEDDGINITFLNETQTSIQ